MKTFLTRFAPALLGLTIVAGTAACTQDVGQASTEDVDVDQTASAVSASEIPGEDFILDLAGDLLKHAIDKAIFGDEIDYKKIDAIFEEDLQRAADKEHLRAAGVDVKGALLTLGNVTASWDPNEPADPNAITTLWSRYNALNNDLASMQEEDMRQLGIRTYITAATVQHAILKTLMVMDPAHVGEHTNQLRDSLDKHLQYVQKRIPEMQQYNADRVGKVDECQYYSQLFQAAYAYYNDRAASGGKDYGIPSEASTDQEAKDWGPVETYSDSKASSWGVPEGTQYRWTRGPGNMQKAMQVCGEMRGRYIGAMKQHLDVQSGFVSDETTPDARILVGVWNDALTKLGGPL